MHSAVQMFDPSTTIFHEYQIVGRPNPTATQPEPKIYKMVLFAKNPIHAKSRFWYFLSRQVKVKRTSGEVLSVSEIFEKSPLVVKNFGIVLRYDSRTGTTNLYKEYRDTTRVGAVQQLYSDLAGRYRARFRSVQIISVDEVANKDVRRANTKQFLNPKLKFPLPHRITSVPKALRRTYAQTRPGTYKH
ncbi:60S ribosomal protein L20 [Planoprotostelium fungivorum]|uniref:60S ribosomal protein L18a n=1 Tax=Planoprotostelium fungivorum TaxID=1890364 RepID=A0A2P6NF31_9EUKA|nr:60S ribosomal protein L20 [Planoprotostelium fungivorum]